MNDTDKDKQTSPAEPGEMPAAAEEAPAAREEIRAANNPATRTGRSFGGIVAVLGLVIAVGGAWIAWPVWGPSLPDGVRSALAPVMEFGRSFTGKKAAALETRLTRLENFVAEYGAVADSARVSEAKRIAEDFRKQEARIANLVKALTDYGSATDVARITESKKFDADLKKLQEQILASREVAALVGRLEKIERLVGGQQTRGSLDVAVLASQLTDLERRLRDMANATTAGKVSNADRQEMSALKSANRQAAEKVAALETANAALQKRLEALDRRLAAAEKRPAVPTDTGPGTDNALLIAVGQLREAVRGTGSYRPAYDSVAALAKKDSALSQQLAALEKHSRAGVADVTALRLKFAATADAVVRAMLSRGGDSWIDQTLDRLVSLVSVRRVGDAAAARDDVQGLVARAEIRLKEGDVAGAVKTLEALSGIPAEAAAGWLEDARARLAVDNAVNALMQAALVRVKP